MRRRQGHGDDCVAILADYDIIDQSELINVDRNFGIVDRFQRFDHTFLDVGIGRFAADLAFGFAGEETGEIIALALEFRSDASARRGVDRVDFFQLDLALLIHSENTRFTCSMPSTSAAMSLLSLCAAKLARAVASTPSTRIKGCAQ